MKEIECGRLFVVEIVLKKYRDDFFSNKVSGFITKAT
jgi:hypothetical protein